MWHVVLPTARPGLATALILGVARGVGETSPVLLTSGAAAFMVTNPTDGAMNSLPLFIYSTVRSGEPTAIARAFAAATVLLVLVLALFVTARLVARQRTGGRSGAVAGAVAGRTRLRARPRRRRPLSDMGRSPLATPPTTPIPKPGQGVPVIARPRALSALLLGGC